MGMLPPSNSMKHSCAYSTKLSDVSLLTRPRYSLVVDEDVKKPTNQTNKQAYSTSHLALVVCLYALQISVEKRWDGSENILIHEKQPCDIRISFIPIFPESTHCTVFMKLSFYSVNIRIKWRQ